MRFAIFRSIGLAAASCFGLTLAVSAPAADTATQNAEVVSGTWQHHSAKFNYFGITSLYTCYGLEDHVKGILEHFGARKGAKVSAQGCPDGPDRPSRTAWVSAEFDTLVPGGEPGAADAVQGQWLVRELRPQRPYFMGDGDCELIEQMKDMISSNLSLRDLDYRTSCIPRSLSINGFDIKAQALIAVPPSKAARSVS
jgi:hypothetical protein